MSIVTSVRLTRLVRQLVPEVKTAVDPTENPIGDDFCEFQLNDRIIEIKIVNKDGKRFVCISYNKSVYGEGFFQTVDGTHLGPVALKIALGLTANFISFVQLAVIDLNPNIGIIHPGPRLRLHHSPEKAKKYFEKHGHHLGKPWIGALIEV